MRTYNCIHFMLQSRFIIPSKNNNHLLYNALCNLYLYIYIFFSFDQHQNISTLNKTLLLIQFFIR